MSKADQVPEPWASRMIEKRLVDPRPKHDVASISALAEEAALHTSTVSDIIYGRRRASVRSLQRLVDVLGPEVAGWLDAAVGEPFSLPDEASLLTQRQRRAITELIRSIAASNSEGGQAHGNAAPTTPPDSGPDELAGRRKQPPPPNDGTVPEDAAARRRPGHKRKGVTEQEPD